MNFQWHPCCWTLKNKVFTEWSRWWRRWLSHCAGFIDNVVVGIIRSLNSSGRTIALGSNLPLTEMSTRDISWWGLKRPVCRADNLATFMWRLPRNSGTRKLMQPPVPVQASVHDIMAYLGSGGRGPFILKLHKLGVVKLTPRPLYPRQNSPQ